MFGELVEQIAHSDDARLLAELREVEARRREDAAREAALLAELDARRCYRADGHATMYGLLRSALHWSDRECRDRMRLARLVSEQPDVGEALHETWVSVANADELARVWASPSIHATDDPAVVHEFAGLLGIARRSEHHEARLCAREFRARHDRQVDAAAADAHEQRSARVHVGPDGAELAAQLGQLDGIEVAEILSVYTDAEWRADWDATVARHGDDAARHLMPRTDAQRRADALVRIFRDAASRPVGSKAPEPVVNVHVDHATFVDLLTEARLFPETLVDPFDDPIPHVTQRRCRTDHGHPVDQATTLRLLLEAHVRIVILGDDGIPIRWGRTHRLFTGAARDAVRMLATRCTHPGCRAPLRTTETDHTIDWSMGGRTDPDNGNPRCRRHNNVKNQGYAVRRDAHGDWHTYRPDGSEVC